MGIAWKSEYATGLPQIDAQHRQLFRFVDSLDRIIESGEVSRGEVDHLLMFLGSYAKSHFAYEEPRMGRYRCPAAQANKAAHREFIAFFERFRVDYDFSAGGSGQLSRLRDFLSAWLVDHICSIDCQLLHCSGIPTSVDGPI